MTDNMNVLLKMGLHVVLIYALTTYSSKTWLLL